ncbi:hypothetical protein [Oleisolibacter albus]|uniref:hypothetical protein n=1 Tax=Oleisolibacter albus TaxID=2171757 RepID=UPI000DF4594C|nr:hypothetical protein [Oleisolibacter albus]
MNATAAPPKAPADAGAPRSAVRPAGPGAASPKPTAPKPTGTKPAGAKPAVRKQAAARPAARRPVRAPRSFRPRLLPATIFAAVLLLGAKVGDVWTTLTTGAVFAGATAEAETPPIRGLAEAPVPVPVTMPVQVAEAKTEPAKAEPAPADAASKEGAKDGAAKPAAPEGKSGQTFTPTEVELLQRLQERREQLDQRARELDQREAMLAAAESRFDQKIAELQTLRKEIQGLLLQLNADQQSQLDSLVKIYETMKPVEAAKIFNDLEMPVLLNVISRMKESKAAPVLAAMSSARAQEVTILLAERKKLPNVPD